MSMTRSILYNNPVPPSIVAFMQAQSTGTLVRVIMTPSLFNQIRVDLETNTYTIVPTFRGANVNNAPFKYDCNQQLRPMRLGIALNQYLHQTIPPTWQFQESQYQQIVQQQQTTTPWKYTITPWKYTTIWSIGG